MDRGDQTPSVPQNSEMHRGDQTPSVPQNSGGEMAPSIWNKLHTYTLIVSPGENVEHKIREFAKLAQTDVFVVTATGVASVVTLVGIRGEYETHSYMRNREIMSLSGIFTIDDYGDVTGYLSISFSDVFHSVRGGRVCGHFKAGGTVKVVLGTCNPVNFFPAATANDEQTGAVGSKEDDPP